MEYCLSLLYVAMDELGLIWCMDAFIERRYKDWKFWGVFAVNLGVSFYLFNFRFLYKGIIINHNKKPSQPTLKRRFFQEKGGVFSWPGFGKEWC